jgi:hypothetical protein
MFVKIPSDGYHFAKKGIKIIEERYNAKYMGYWCTKHGESWKETPVDVFYVENPDRSKGHSNYFGMFRKGENVFITNAESCFADGMTGVLSPDGEVGISRYRHHMQAVGAGAIDGGRDYIKVIGEAVWYPTIRVTVEGGEFVCTELMNA